VVVAEEVVDQLLLDQARVVLPEPEAQVVVELVQLDPQQDL
jgi:hypothetical protein